VHRGHLERFGNDRLKLGDNLRIHKEEADAMRNARAKDAWVNPPFLGRSKPSFLANVF
jgi:hypothetical protein